MMMLPPPSLIIFVITAATILYLHLPHTTTNIACSGFVPPFERLSRVNRPQRGVLPSSINDDDDGNSDEEWRAFRARLVRNGLPSLGAPVSNDTPHRDTSTRSSKKTSNDCYAHVTTPLVEVGSILISIPTTDLCQALEQQYWHRSVVLITEVSDNVVKGNIEEIVPEEQLAYGKRRGRWSYRGLLLNRCTNLVLGGNSDNHNKTVPKEEQYDRTSGNDITDGYWSVQRGGDLLGLDSSSGTEFVCLHHLGRIDTRDARSTASSSLTKLVGNLSCITLADAQSLCRSYPTSYHPTSDFATFGGFCSWRPGQLELEMGEDRNEWMVLSVDGESIWQELQSQQIYSQQSSPKMLEPGTDMWRSFLRMIGVSEQSATKRLPAGQLDFYDRMLEVWADDNLDVHRENDESSSSHGTILNDCSGQIGPGTLLRAKSPPTNDMLLYDAEFIRSLILVLEDSSSATVGIILNHPMAAAVECKDGGDPLPLRYGGPIDFPSWKDGSYRDHVELSGDNDEEVEDEMYYEGFMDYQNNGVSFDDLVFDDVDVDSNDDDDDSSFIWIHRDSALGARGPNGKGGIQLGTSKLWLIKEDDALVSLQSGILQLEDTMIFSGVCIWEKGPKLGLCSGGLREQVDALHSLEVVRACHDLSDNDVMEHVWDILTNCQSILTKESLESNTNAAINAWEKCSSNETMDLPIAKNENNDVSRSRLSDATLKAWLGVNLLEDPLGTLVELRDDQRRELFGQ